MHVHEGKNALQDETWIEAKNHGQETRISGKDLGRILGLLAKVNPPKTPGSWPRECPQDPKILEPLGQDCWPKIPRLRCKILAKMFPLGHLSPGLAKAPPQPLSS